MGGSRGRGPNCGCCGCPIDYYDLITFGVAFKSNSDGTFSTAATFTAGLNDSSDDGPNGGDYRNDDNFFLIRRPTINSMPSYQGTFQLYQACKSSPTFIQSPQNPDLGPGFEIGAGAFSQGPQGYICNYTSSTSAANVYRVSASGCSLIAQMAAATGVPIAWSGDDFLAVYPPGGITGGSATFTGNIAYTFDGQNFTAQSSGAIPLPPDIHGAYSTSYTMAGPIFGRTLIGYKGGVFAWNGGTFGFWLQPTGTGGACGFVTMQRSGNNLSSGTAFPLAVSHDSIAADSLADPVGAYAISPDGSIVAFVASQWDAGAPNALYPPSRGTRGDLNRVHVYKNGTLTASVLPSGAGVQDFIWTLSISDDGKALAAASYNSTGGPGGTVSGATTIWKINSDGSLTQLDQKGPGQVAFFSHQYRCPV